MLSLSFTQTSSNIHSLILNPDKIPSTNVHLVTKHQVKSVLHVEVVGRDVQPVGCA